MKTILFSFFALICTQLSAQNYTWSQAPGPWPESFGSQRAVVEITKPCTSAELEVVWRRHDPNAAGKRFLIINGTTGDTIRNINRLEVNQEMCRLQFGPIDRPGTYYFYYLPFEVTEGWGYYDKGYLKPENPPDPEWLKLTSFEKSRTARILGIECRTPFDSFFPMEIIPTQLEKTSFLKKHSEPVLFFTESREYPIRMKDEVPYRWIKTGPSSEYKGSAQRNEYFTFQIGVYAARTEIENLTLITGNLSSHDSPEIPLTCFNTAGIDPYGVPFTKQISIPAGRVQALWIGADIPASAKHGEYTGEIVLKASNLPDRTIRITLKVGQEILEDRGDSEPWRHSRLRWLNSVAGSDGTPVPPYRNIEKLSNGRIRVADHEILTGKNGLPELIQHGQNQLLADPVEFLLESPEGRIPLTPVTSEEQQGTGDYIQHSKATNGQLELAYKLRMEYDGYLSYSVTVKNRSGSEPAKLKDIRLSIPIAAAKAKYMMGMGLPGGVVPAVHQSGWKGPSDSFWIGDTGAGIWCELRGGTYHGPLLNLYRPAPPSSWNNEGRGGFRIVRSVDRVIAEAYSGERILSPGDSVLFEWSFLITPVRKVDPASQFNERYYHHGGKPTPDAADFRAGVKIVNVHHANEYNPYINYPFLAVAEMKSLVDSMHSLGKKTKIYYTVRELTNHVTEIWALRSLNTEILADGSGGGYPWLQEHFIDGYTPQWYHHFPDGRVDASVLSAPGDSRWLNYYIEGLSWLVRNVNIDGLYLDDVSFDRRILKRMRRVMDQVRPGCLIDLHSNTGFSIGPANQYAEFFPFVDKIWFGESFQYDRMPVENWLVEVSGIPFGLMGDMLQGGGNRWLGMVFGMTVRYPWTTEGILCDPKPVWKIWDEFGIADASMKGFWDRDCPIIPDQPEIKATAYIKSGKTLVAIGNFSDQAKEVGLAIDWKSLGINPSKCRIYAPAIQNFQEACDFDLRSKIAVQPRKGWLVYIEGL